MFKSVIGCSLAISAALLGGCKDDETKQAAPAAATQPGVPDVTALAPPAEPTSAPTTAPSAADLDPKALLDETLQEVQNKKWDDADAALKKLEAIKDQLPANWQSELKALRSEITAGKAASALQVPAAGQ